MTQKDLDHAIARATGESLRTIRRFGFSVVPGAGLLSEAESADHEPQMVDWDQLERDRLALAMVA